MLVVAAILSVSLYGLESFASKNADGLLASVGAVAKFAVTKQRVCRAARINTQLCCSGANEETSTVDQPREQRQVNILQGSSRTANDFAVGTIFSAETKVCPRKMNSAS